MRKLGTHTQSRIDNTRCESYK